jgi:hypothetical protein
MENPHRAADLLGTFLTKLHILNASSLLPLDTRKREAYSGTTSVPSGYALLLSHVRSKHASVLLVGRIEEDTMRSRNMAPEWRESIDLVGGDIQHPLRSIRRLNRREAEELEAEHAEKQAAKQRAQFMPLQASPSVSQIFNLGAQQPLRPLAVKAPQTPRQKSNSPMPQDIDSGAG